ILASVARISAFPQEAIKPSQTLAGDLGFDSLMTVELDGDIHKAFPTAGGLPPNLLGPQTTVQDVIDHLARAVAQPHARIAPVLEAHRTARAQAAGAAGGLFVVATAGADEADAALAGYAKALARERGDELVKCVELRADDGAAAMAHALFAELRSGSAAPE